MRSCLVLTVMMPVYQQNRFYSLYFIVFLLIGKKCSTKKLNKEITNKLITNEYTKMPTVS